MLKGACLPGCFAARGVFSGVIGLLGSVGLKGYRKERGEKKQLNTRQKQLICMTCRWVL